eukprot:CAMPEP_0174322580 /NCGR_PEP_ID=MMETSP0810-20121108/11095_1 /TAXON_ID=73025 ORGANISM="Eutreptiella gymnastica-like, Strain CCMP1594" /NCGR_SAMPLE_ID=MMETSP0810 /ASSEMBLY_ACC=CAM_ASM_000659 /LENGTH=63 /DNA_ID=CAMNT_0015434441 /DNA_START=279 /DNA_END=470 /DNA_ORIENTATION=+
MVHLPTPVDTLLTLQRTTLTLIDASAAMWTGGTSGQQRSTSEDKCQRTSARVSECRRTLVDTG